MTTIWELWLWYAFTTGRSSRGRKSTSWERVKTRSVEPDVSAPFSDAKTNEIKTGEVGIVVLGLKNVGDVQVGDTITDAKRKTAEAVGGFKQVKQFVFAGLYPIETDKFEELRDALDKLKLNDSSISYEPETSAALGFGFRVGFLGLLHMEVIKERLERSLTLI